MNFSTVNILKSLEEKHLVDGCLKSDPKAQELLYRHFYGYAMSVALRYSPSRDEALEVLNDSFLKVFKNLKKHDRSKSLKAWIRRIVINTALDKIRRNQKYAHDTDLENAQYEQFDESVLDKISADEIMEMVQALPDSYRTIFSLYEVEGFTHVEISKLLGIPVGTSKSHLSRAKTKLREMLGKLALVEVR